VPRLQNPKRERLASMNDRLRCHWREALRWYRVGSLGLMPPSGAFADAQARIQLPARWSERARGSWTRRREFVPASTPALRDAQRFRGHPSAQSPGLFWTAFGTARWPRGVIDESSLAVRPASRRSRRWFTRLRPLASHRFAWKLQATGGSGRHLTAMPWRTNNRVGGSASAFPGRTSGAVPK
jgi:hypothetical protein